MIVIAYYYDILHIGAMI